MPPFEDDLPQIVALFPAVFAVLDRALRVGDGPVGGRAVVRATKPAIKGSEHLGNVVAGLRAGEIVRAGELLVGADRLLPRLEQVFAATGQVVSQDVGGA